MDSSDVITLWVKAHGEGVLSQDAPTGASYRMPSDPAPTRPDPVQRDEPSDELPDFELGEELGRGGMGQVFRARQISLDRDVAIKVIRAEQRTPRARERFLAEARVSGALDHPNIVPVHALGETAGGHVFLAMKRVSGRSWKALLHPASEADRDAASKVALEGHLAILSSVCNAVAFAHARHIVHRDLKPENVMVGAFGEVMVMDWGIAVDIRESAVAGSPAPHRTQCTAPAGTPVYMPPELALGHGERIGPWTDTYLLGAILCEVLTGHPPHRGATLTAILGQAAKSDPPALPDDVPADLAAVVRKALSCEPKDRYQSALELQAAIQQHLTYRESDRIAVGARKRLEAAAAARDPGADARRTLYSELADVTSAFGQALVLWPENAAAVEGSRAARSLHARLALAGGDLGLARAQIEALGAAADAALVAQVDAAERQAVKRETAARRVRRTAGGLALALVVGLVVGFLWIRAERNEAQAQRNEARAQRETAEARRKDAERARDEAAVRLAQFLVAEADTQALAHDPEAARRRYEEARDAFAKHNAPTRPAQLGLLELYDHAPPALLTLGRQEVAGPVRRGNQTTRDFVTFSPDGTRILTGGADQLAQLYDARTGRLIRELTGHYARVSGGVFLPGDRVATTGDDGVLRIWNLKTGKEEKAKPLCKPSAGFALHDLTACDGGRVLLVAGGDGLVSAVDPLDLGIKTLKVEDPQMPNKPRPKLQGLSVTPGGHRMLAVTGGRSSPRVWNLTNDTEVVRLEEGGKEIRVGAISPNGRLVALCADAREIVLLSCPEGKVRGRLAGHRERVEKLAFSPDSKLLASAGRDQAVRVWDVATQREERVFTGHREAVRSLAFAPDGQVLATGADDGTVKLWPVTARPERVEWKDLGSVSVIEFTTDSRLALAQSYGYEPWFVDVASGARLSGPRLPGKLQGRARLAAGGRALVFATIEPPALNVMDVTSGEIVARKRLEKAEVPGSYGLAVARNGSSVFTLGTEVADPTTGGTVANPDARIGVHDFNGTGLTPDRDLKGLQFSRPEDVAKDLEPFGQLKILGPTIGGLVPSVRAGGFDCLEVAPDGTWLAAAAGRLVQRDTITGRLLREVASRAYGVRRIAISADGSRIASCGGERAIRICDAATGELVTSANDETGSVTAIAFSRDGGLIAGASHAVHLYDTATGRRTRTFQFPEEDVREVQFSPDGRWLVAGGKNATVAWDLEYPGRVAAAERALREATVVLTKNPSDAASLATFARWYLLRGLAAPARALLAEARVTLPPREALQLALLSGDPWEALNVVNSVDARSALPAFYVSRLRAGLRSLDQEARPKALDAEADRYLRAAGDAVDLEDWKGAVAAADRGLARRPKDPSLLARRARGYMGLRKYPEALADATRWTEVSPDNAVAHYARYLILIRMNDLDAAAPALRRALEVSKSYNATYVQEAVVFEITRAKNRLRSWIR